MTLPDAPAQAPSAGPTEPVTYADPGVHRELRAAAGVALALALIGAALGPLWAWWSPPGPRALVVTPGVFIPDETEAFVAGDGRYLVIAAAVGLLAAIAAWTRRPARGALVMLALAVGGIAGSLLMELVGHLSGGGTFDGARDTLIDRLPLSLHSQGLLFVEPALAVLVYGMLVAFTADDDLGRSDPVRERLAGRPALGADAQSVEAQSVEARSVDAGDEPQHAGGHGDAPGAAQQRDLPA